MSHNLLIAILINIGLLLIASWGFSVYIISGLNREKKRLIDELAQLRQQKPSQVPPAIRQEPALAVIEEEDTLDYSHLLDDMAQEIREKEDRIDALLRIKDNQQNAQTALKADDINEEMIAYLAQLEADFEETEKIVLSLQCDLNRSQDAMKRMEKELALGKSQSARVFALEKAERSLRDENKNLRNTGIQIAEKLELRNQQLSQLKDHNSKLKKTIASLANASKEQLATINKLHAQVERAEQLEAHQRQLITDLENRLNTEKGSDNDLEKVNAMEEELEILKDTLKRTLIEKDFIEEHMLELDSSLEKAKETEAALARAQKEIETLEKHFPEFEPTPPSASAIREAFTTDNPELQNIIDNHRLFGSIQEFWMTLDLPPIIQVEQQPIPIPSIEDWVQITIGDNDYTVLLTIDEELAKTVTETIFKEENDDSNQEQKDTTGELGNIVAGTLATELNNDFPVSVPQHINRNEAELLLVESTVVSEILLLSRQQPLYAVLTIPKTA